MVKKRQKSKKKLTSFFYPTPRQAMVIGITGITVYCFFLLARYIIQDTIFFKAENVVVSGNQYLDQKLIKKIAKIDLNQTIFQVNMAEVTNNLLKNTYIQGVSVSRVLPSTILIDVQERAPILYLVDKFLYMVDESGMMLKMLPQMAVGKLPIVTGLSIKELKKDRSPLFQAIKLIKRIHEVDETLFPVISEIHIRKKKWPDLYLIKGGARVILGDNNHYQRLFLLSQFFNKNNIVNELPIIKRIDLRFTNQIIVQKKS